MNHDQTLKLVTNLDRPAIEQKLGQVCADAKSKNLPELASLFSGVEGMPRAQMQQRIGNALKWLADKPEHKGIAAQLELVELNLPNL